MSFVNQTYEYPDDLVVTIRVEAPRALTADELRWVVAPIVHEAEGILEYVKVYGLVETPRTVGP